VRGSSAFDRVRSFAGLPVTICAVVVFCGIYIDLVFYRIHALRLGVDTGTYLQTLVNFVHTGSTYNFGEHRPKIWNHDSWTVILGMAPFIAVFPQVETPLIAEVVVVAVAAIPLYFLGRSFGLSQGSASIPALAYLISPSAQGWVFDNFTELHFVPLLAFSLALAARRRSLVWTIALAELLTGVKEDESLFLIWFGIASVLWYDRRLGIAGIVIGLTNWFGYAWLQHRAGYIPHDPGYRLYDPHWLTHLAFLAEVLAPFAFLPLLLGRVALLALPFVLEITLNAPWLGGQEFAHGGNFYTIPLVSVIAIGAVVAAARYPQRVRYVLPCAVVMMLFFNTTVLRLGRHEYPPDWPAYCAAKAASRDGRVHVYGHDREAVFAIAASNLNVHFTASGTWSVRPLWWSGAARPATPSGPAGCSRAQ
jgi:uncharacterized membrane protein